MLFFTAAFLLCAVQNQRIHEAIVMNLDPELFCACALIAKPLSKLEVMRRQFTVNFILHEETPSMKKKFVSSSLRP